MIYLLYNLFARIDLETLNHTWWLVILKNIALKLFCNFRVCYFHKKERQITILRSTAPFIRSSYSMFIRLPQMFLSAFFSIRILILNSLNDYWQIYGNFKKALIDFDILFMKVWNDFCPSRQQRKIRPWPGNNFATAIYCCPSILYWRYFRANCA